MTTATARLTLATATALALSTATAGSPAAASDQPPSVQVVMPVIDGGVTVVVSLGTPTTPVQPAPAVPAPAPPVQIPAPQTPPPQTWSAPPAPAPTPAQTAPPQNARGQSGPALPPLPTAIPTYVTPSSPGKPGSNTMSSSTPGPAPSTTGKPTTSTTPNTPNTPEKSGPTQQAAGPSTAKGGPIKLGVFGHSTERTVRFQAKMGRPVDIVSVFPARGSWDTIMDTWWLDRAPEVFTGTLDVGVPLWQEDGDLATAAQGGYNARWEELGRVIHERYPGSSVRIGWEFNLGGWKHHATDDNVEQWKEAFRHASTSLKKGGPSLLVNWNPNKGKGDSLGDASKAWPGDDVVDIVGLDGYDWWPAYSESTWPEHRDSDQGWKYWVDFARSHGKQFSTPEWGVAPGNDHGGGDNPYYIGVVMDFLMEEHAKDGIIHSAVYFDEPEGYIANSIADGQVPLAGAALVERVKNLGSAPQGTAPAPAGTPPPPATDAPHDGSKPEDGDKGDAQDEDSKEGGEKDGGDADAAATQTPAEESKPSSSEWRASGGHGPVPT